MSVSPISATTGARVTAADDQPTSARIPQQVLGQDDFLRLLAVQFQAQDPMKPMEDTAFIAQMAQFSALEQSSNMAASLEVIRGYQLGATANSYLGHRVTFDTGDGESFTGDVDAIDLSGSAPRLRVGERSFSLSAVLRVEPGVLSASTSTSTTTLQPVSPVANN